MKYKVGDRVWWGGDKYIYIGSLVSNAVYVLSLKPTCVYDVISNNNIKPIITLYAEL